MTDRRPDARESTRVTADGHVLTGQPPERWDVVAGQHADRDHEEEREGCCRQ
ncbi:hypothetical protein GCM10027282_25220 [Frigoribacterium salinisoli]